MAKSASSTRNLEPQVPGDNSPAPADPTAAAPQGDQPSADPVVIPDGLVAELEAKSNEDLIALDAAEREGDNRPGYLAAIDQVLQVRIKAMQPSTQLPGAPPPPPAPVVDAVPVAALASSSQRPKAADIDPTKITQPVLCEEGWVVPSPRSAPQS